MKNVLLLLMVLGTVSVQAQRNLEGKILFDNAPLEGVRIKLNNEEMAISSNEKGDFTIEVKEGDFLYFNSQGARGTPCSRRRRDPKAHPPNATQSHCLG
jgi:hypothetical protein